MFKEVLADKETSIHYCTIANQGQVNGGCVTRCQTLAFSTLLWVKNTSNVKIERNL